jgi:hypothetical protein
MTQESNALSQAFEVAPDATAVGQIRDPYPTFA